MNRIFVSTKYFDNCWNNLNLNDDDLRIFQEYLLDNPEVGDIIQGTGGVRKIRWNLPNSNKGKSGGIRILYIDYMYYEKIYLLVAYPKSKQESISDKAKQDIKTIVKSISEQLKDNSKR
jgi:hypothetical protein